jgi:glycosyltransferase involved in cell wall biosynthesis
VHVELGRRVRLQGRVSSHHAEAAAGGVEPRAFEAALALAAADLVEAGRVRFLGERPLDELSGHLAAADVLVSPRLTGVNTPLKIYSYMDAGKAILATRLQTHTQVLDDTTALLAEPEPGSMAAAIRTLARSRELRARLGTAARRRVESEYSAERFRERLRSFYEGLSLGNGGNGARSRP